MLSQILSIRKARYILLLLVLVVCLYLGLIRLMTPNRSFKRTNVQVKSVWSDACPTWPPDPATPANGSLVLTGGMPSPDMTNMLFEMLRERLGQVKDRPIPDFSKSCDISSPDLLACTSYDCKDKISDNLEDRVKDVLSAPELQLTNEHRAAIAAFSNMFPADDILIVSATSSNHFGETQKMFKSLHEVVYPTLKNFTAVLVDIGLTEAERKRAEAKCRCRVVRFPHHLF
ncbi:hypothetical protein EGW08_015089, partial [Elysia chlorotica]